MEKILVTGGAGFIGSHVCDLLIHQEKQVVIADNMSSGKHEHVNNMELFEVDITDAEKLEELFRLHDDIDGVIHLAAQSKAPTSIKAPQYDANININGTINVLELTRKYGIKHFLYASSAAVYGDQQTLPITEDAPVEPLSPYGVSKYAGEAYVKAYSRMYDLNAHVLRFANVYGPRQSADTEAGVITIFIEQLLNGEQPVIYGDGKQTRDFIYVKDVAWAVVTCLCGQQTAAVYNVSSGEETSITDLLHDMCALLDKPYRPQYGEIRPGDIEKSYLDNSKITKDFLWQPVTTLRDGLRDTIRHANA
ncbi:NAD-dependent epimerase/dehydratase family protein [Natribacillus halophilus]|uniref:UDP-glucose 4-epimerase n=1 Tax=Natribacillus halophilus TaxID=549003 RepID=A0A1G8SRP3_9BACI|nr:NAD-dependent epimerase/dehydratase family protein [Natribacillus halophilus]SDJ31877.1 UDP-glucose 4-epimerase [Natribacillus halophilus]